MAALSHGGHFYRDASSRPDEKKGCAGAPGFTHIKYSGGIDEYRLDRGASARRGCRTIPAPVVTLSRGIAQRGDRYHERASMLEHMMFKAKRCLQGRTQKATASSSCWSASAGKSNANTSFDRTNQGATIGRESLEGYIAIEVHSHPASMGGRVGIGNPNEMAVRNEYLRGKNDPENVLMEAESDFVPPTRPARTTIR